MRHLSLDELNAGLDEIRNSPRDNGPLLMIVRRPLENEREMLAEAQITISSGLVGDIWSTKPSSSTPDGGPHPAKQITIMNCRAAQHISSSPDRWALAGDQLFVDMNLGYENLPPGTQLAIGTAILEVSEPPHRGCKKFAGRFGQDAMRFVNSDAGRELNLRGINCKVIQSGLIKKGDTLQKK
jgi:hypothetical protein